MTVTLYKYYVKEENDNWIAYDPSRVSSNKVVSNYWDKLNNLEGFKSFEIDYPETNIMRHIFIFDVTDDKAENCFKNFIKQFRNFRDSIVREYHDYMNKQYLDSNTKLPSIFYKTIDSNGKIIKYKNISI